MLRQIGRFTEHFKVNMMVAQTDINLNKNSPEKREKTTGQLSIHLLTIK